MVSLAALPEETVAHIQSAGCKAQKKSVIGAHNRCWGYLRGAILTHGEAKRNLEFVLETKTGSCNSCGQKQRLATSCQWEDVEGEAERLLD